MFVYLSEILMEWDHFSFTTITLDPALLAILGTMNSLMTLV